MEKKEEWPGLADEIMDTCLVNKYARKDEDRFKLRPTQRDRAAFESVIRGDVPSGNGRIRSAYLYMLDSLDKGDLEGHPLDLRKLKVCITHYLDLVSITLDLEDSPHRIFESLNNTGMRLGSSDLIRNFLFMSIPDEPTQRQAYQEYWFPMQEATGQHLNDFFWCYLMMDGSLPRSDETFNEVKKRLGTPSAQDTIQSLKKWLFRTFGERGIFRLKVGWDRFKLFIRPIDAVLVGAIGLVWPGRSPIV